MARLSKQEWIDAGLRSLASYGVEAVRVERLAKELNVTKGSFYWHFRDRQALLSALLEAWQSRATNAIIAEVDAKGGDAAARLRSLLTIVSQSDGRLDRAVRAWAAQDVMAERTLEKIDRRRLAYLVGLFQGLRFSTSEANARARLIYQALIGQFVMGTPLTRPQRQSESLDIVFPMLVHAK